MALAQLTRPDGTVALNNAGTGATTPLINSSFGTVTKAAAKGSAGVVMAIIVTSINAGLRYFQIHNKATAPVATDVPIISIPLAAGTATVPALLTVDERFLTINGLFLPLGLGWAISTTLATFTDAATATDHTVNFLYY